MLSSDSDSSADSVASFEWFRQSSPDEIIDRFYGVLRNLASRMLGTFPKVRRWEDTGDVWQAAAIKLHRALGNREIESELHLFRLASVTLRHTLIDLARRHDRPGCFGADHETRHGDIKLEDLAAEPSHVADPITLSEWAEFHESVDQLPDEQKAVFDLLWYLELSQEQAAQLLGVSIRTIQRRWRNARIALYRMQIEPDSE